MKKPVTKFQYPINKKVEDILNWLETEMYEIPSEDYKGVRIHYSAELVNYSVEVSYWMYDIRTKENVSEGVLFSFDVGSFDDSTSVITGRFYSRDLDTEKLALTYLRKLGVVTSADWIEEVSKRIEEIESIQTEQVGTVEGEKPKQKGRYRLTSIEIKRRKEIVKEANQIFKESIPKKTWKQIAYELDIPERTLRDWRHSPQY